MKYLSLFSGVGTGEKGVEQAYGSTRFARGADADGFADCIGYAEIDKYASAIYRYHYPEHHNFGDATSIVCNDLPNFDFLIAGFPCQAFSIAGKRQGFNEARGTLFFEIARILSHKRPKHFLLENVGGLRSHDSGRTMQRILGVLSDLGYFVEVPLLNSKDYGVPQNRERVFFIGHLADGCEREILSIGHGNGEAFSPGCVEPVSGNRVYDSDGIACALSALGGGGSAKTGMYAVPVLTPDRPTKRQNGRRFKDDGDDAFTLTAQDKHGVFTDQRIRRLTPIECERLQGLPDDWTKYGLFDGKVQEVSDTQRYKCCGNSFTVNVIESIITRMLEKGCL